MGVVFTRLWNRPRWGCYEGLPAAKSVEDSCDQLEEGDTALVAAALGDIARAKGMTEVARKTGLGRESLYKALSPDGNPESSTVLKVIQALGSGQE